MSRRRGRVEGGLDEYELSVLREATEKARHQANSERPPQEQKKTKPLPKRPDQSAAAAAVEQDGVVIVDLHAEENAPTTPHTQPHLPTTMNNNTTTTPTSCSTTQHQAAPKSKQ